MSIADEENIGKRFREALQYSHNHLRRICFHERHHVCTHFRQYLSEQFPSFWNVVWFLDCYHAICTGEHVLYAEVFLYFLTQVVHSLGMLKLLDYIPRRDRDVRKLEYQYPGSGSQYGLIRPGRIFSRAWKRSKWSNLWSIIGLSTTSVFINYVLEFALTPSI